MADSSSHRGDVNHELMGEDVAVVIPTHDRPELLRRALASVHTQTARPREVIVVQDGGISATTQVVIDDIRTEHGVAVRLLGSHGGASKARNVGLDEVTTEFIAFLDDDDHWRPTFVERTLAVLRGRSEPTAVFTAATVVRAGDEVIWMPHVSDSVAMLTANGGFGGQNGMFPTDAVRAVDGWDEQLAAFQDRDLQLRLGIAGLAFEVWPEALTVIDQSHARPRISTTRRADGCWQFTRKWWSWAPLRRRPAMLWQLAMNQHVAGSRWRRALWRLATAVQSVRDLSRRAVGMSRLRRSRL
jgi:glycosyltransferase involved in cell wall biosynthesis